MNFLASFMNLAGPDLIVILLIVLVLFGAKKLPELARGMGQAVKEFQKAKDEFNDELNKAGKTEPIIVGMEISLNGELSKHGQYMESHFSWLWPELKSKDDQPIRRAVAYRLANPYTGPDLSKAESWKPGIDMQDDFVKQVIEGQKIEGHYLDKVLKYYGDMAHNSSLQPTPKAGAAERER